MTMKNKLTFYLLVSIFFIGAFPINMWGEINKVQLLSNENASVDIDIPLIFKAGRKQRSIIFAPCSVSQSDNVLILSLHELYVDLEIIISNTEGEALRFRILQTQQGSEVSVNIDAFESGSYTMEITTSSGDSWYGYFMK